MKRLWMSFFGSMVWCVAILFVAEALPNEVSYEITAQLDVQNHEVIARQRVTITNRTAQTLPELYFHVPPNAFTRGADTAYQRDLKTFLRADVGRVYANETDDASLTIQRITVAGNPVEFLLDDTLLLVALPQPLAPNETITLSMNFVNDLIVAAAGNVFAGSFAVRSGFRNGVYTVAKWYPQLVVYDEQGWHLDPYRLMGEFYSDYGDYALRLTLPQTLIVGATGELVSQADNPDGTQTLLFEAQRVRDVAWAASSRFRVSEVEWEGKLIRTLWLSNARIADLVLDSVKYFSQTFGQYAYGTLTAVQVEVGGGMEYPGLIMIARGGVEEVSHEVAHQWWYGAVGSNEFDETWLDEGPTTFSSELYRIESRGEPDTLRRMLTFLEPGVPVLTPSAAFTSNRTFGQVIYSKGSSLFWMLREVLGASLLQQALQTYYERFKYRNASTQDLIDTFAEVAQQDLDWFFDQWLRTGKVLDVAISDVETQVQPDGAYLTTFNIAHEGTAQMPVRIRVFAENDVLEEMVWAGKARQTTLSVVTQESPTRIELDPGRTLLEADRNDNVWTPATLAFAPTLGWMLAIVVAGGLWRRLTQRSTIR